MLYCCSTCTVDPQQRLPQPSSPLVTPEQLRNLQLLSAQQADNADNMESDEEEPAPEALKRYMAMRRHTIGVGDSEHDTPQDTRTKLAHHKPMIGTCLGLYDYMYHNTQIQVK